MKIDGTYTFEAPREMVYDMLQDPEVLTKIIPGCEHLIKVAENEYEAVLEINIGPVKGQFKGKVSLSEMNPPESYRMEINGRGTTGFVKGVGLVQLTQEGAATLMSYEGDAQIGGRIASVGQRFLDSAAKALTRQSLDGVNQHIQARVQTLAQKTIQPPPELQAPSQVEFATGVAKGVLDDLIPSKRQPLVIGGGLVALGLLLYLILGPSRRKKVKNM